MVNTSLLLTIDVEADDEWSGLPERTYRNIFALPRLQELCDEFGARPTYLVTHDVCMDGVGAGIIADLATTGRCEIGAHLHAWTTPPAVASLEAEVSARPYLSEYLPDVQREKLAALTDALTEVASVRPTSFRGGRWDVDLTCLDLLAEAGYQVDTSVTPLVSWARARGVTKGGPVHSTAPVAPYHPSRTSVCVPGDHPILEVPVSIGLRGWLSRELFGRLSARFEGMRVPWAALKRILRWTGAARRVWLDAVTETADDMLALCRVLIAAGIPTLNVALHSSELAAGCAPHVADAAAESGVWDRLRSLLEFAQQVGFGFMTLAHVRESAECTADLEAGRRAGG